MTARKTQKRKKWGSGSYVALPHAVLRSHGYAHLSARAVKLLNDLLSQYHGNINLAIKYLMQHRELKGA